MIRPPKRLIDEITDPGPEHGASSRAPKWQKNDLPRTHRPGDLMDQLRTYNMLDRDYEDVMAVHPDFWGPNPNPNYVQATKDIGDIHTMISAFSQELQKKVLSFDNSCDALEKDGLKNPLWWWNVDLFSSRKPAPCRVFLD
jgi:hypothetical protein